MSFSLYDSRILLRAPPTSELYMDWGKHRHAFLVRHSVTENDSSEDNIINVLDKHDNHLRRIELRAMIAKPDGLKPECLCSKLKRGGLLALSGGL